MFISFIGAVFIIVALQDSFETLVLPRRVTRRWRLARVYFRTAWSIWRKVCGLFPAGRYRENMLSVFGPLALFGLFACWVTMLIAGFSLVHFGQTTLQASSADFRDYLYHSGETFFTLGYGDVTPATYTGKLLAVAEAGTGFGFMAIIIGYLPVLYQAFSSREQRIALLDARAGSPPTAGEFLRRFNPADHEREVENFLFEWERWSAELLESHLSFPVLSYYRSQHDNQSWLAAISTVLDVSAVVLTTGSPPLRRRAELTFAMARHACVDLCLVFWLPPIAPRESRLTASQTAAIKGFHLDKPELDELHARRINELRELYEPFLQALSSHFCIRLPGFFPEGAKPDNWQTSAWTKRAPELAALTANDLPAAEHFG